MNHNLTDFLKQAKRFIGKVPFTKNAIAGLGFTDDASVIATALATVCAEIEEAHWQQAERFFNS
jgi:uncharacterized membrane protein YkvA (DUF1232 family)